MAFYGDPPPDDSTMLLIMLRASADRWQTLDTVRPAMLRTRCVDDDLNDLSVLDNDVLTRRLRDALNQLLAAGLVVQSDDGFLATPRGHEALRDHPHGIDGSVLMHYAEYRHHIAQIRPRAEEHPVEADAALESGLFAHGLGRRPTENPYEPDTLEHVAWQHGWHEGWEEEAREREIHRAFRPH